MHCQSGEAAVRTRLGESLFTIGTLIERDILCDGPDSIALRRT